MLRKFKTLVLASALMAACGGGGKSTEKSGNGKDCASTFICIADCQTETCAQACMNGVSQATQQQMTKLATCSNAASCDAAQDAEACLWDNCDTEMRSCGL